MNRLHRLVAFAVALSSAGCATAPPATAVRTDGSAAARQPDARHPDAVQIAVSPDGRSVVTADARGGLRVLDTVSRTVATLRSGGVGPLRPIRGRLEFTSDGILLNVPPAGEGVSDLVGLRAGTWKEVRVAAAPRAAPLLGGLAGLPEQGHPATALALPPEGPDGSGRVLGLVGRPSDQNHVNGDAPAVTSAYDGTTWTLWEAATGTVLRTLDEFPVGARPSAAFPDGAFVLAVQYHAILRLDLASGRRIWWADPFEVGGGPPPRGLRDLLAWALSSGERTKPGTRFEGVGVAADGTRAVVSMRRSAEAEPPATESPATQAPPTEGAEGAGPARKPFTVAVLDAEDGRTLWLRTSNDPGAAAWIGPGGKTLLFAEKGAALLLDVEDGHVVTPAGWAGQGLAIRAAAAAPDGRGIWVVLADGGVRRLDLPGAPDEPRRQ